MTAANISFTILIVALAVAATGLIIRVTWLWTGPQVSDPSPPRASVKKGVAYAFTAGMLPWKKESARLHLLVYVRGILLHLGIFTFIILLFVSLFTDVRYLTGAAAFSPTLGLGFLAGAIALTARLTDKNLHAISRPDDYISLVLVMLVMLAGFLYVLGAVNRTVFWGVVSALCFYLPWSKIPHVAYFFFSRTVFGTLFGRRGVLPGPGKITQSGG